MQRLQKNGHNEVQWVYLYGTLMNEIWLAPKTVKMLP